MLDELKPYRSSDIVANTSGYDCFIDGHSHTENARTVVTNRIGREVVVAQTGSFLATVGRLELAQQLRDGCSYEEITRKLNVSRSRVNRVVESIYAKLGVHGKSRLGDYVW